MSLFKKLPFIDEITKRYEEEFAAGSFERYLIQKESERRLSELKGIDVPRYPIKKYSTGATAGEWGFLWGWRSYLKSREKREGTERFMSQLEQFLVKINVK